MDALLDVLRGMHLTGGIFLDAEFSAPWCVTSKIGPEDCRPFLSQPAHVIAYHYVTAGRLLLQVGAQSPVALKSGEIVVLPRNEEHRLASAPGLCPVSADDLIQSTAEGGLARIVYGGGGDAARILCGFLACDAPNSPILGILPSVFKLDVAEEASGSWVESSFRFAAQELAAGRPGSTTILAKLAELMFVAAVHRYLAMLPAADSGWLAGLHDPIIGRALMLLHRRMADDWTSAALAREVGLSRSAFADRFTNLVGEPPMRYLMRCRLQFAAQRLRTSPDPIARIAFDAGYESEAAFSRIFKREYGLPPAAWRKQNADSV